MTSEPRWLLAAREIDHQFHDTLPYSGIVAYLYSASATAIAPASVTRVYPSVRTCSAADAERIPLAQYSTIREFFESSARSAKRPVSPPSGMFTAPGRWPSQNSRRERTSIVMSTGSPRYV